MQATHNIDEHPLPCNKTLSMVETLKLNNPAVLIWLEQANSTIIISTTKKKQMLSSPQNFSVRLPRSPSHSLIPSRKPTDQSKKKENQPPTRLRRRRPRSPSALHHLDPRPGIRDASNDGGHDLVLQ
jgi:hypothetical protein